MNAQANEQSFLVNIATGNGVVKNKYTQVDDKTIISMHKNGCGPQEIGVAIGRTTASVRYRMGKVLAIMKDLSEYNYESGRSNLSTKEKATRQAEHA